MSENLNQQLQAREEVVKSNTPAKYQILQQSIEYLKQTGLASGLLVGDTAPDFTLTDAVGKKVRLYDKTAEGPVILTFYRGGWCPFCNLQLRSYQEVLPQFQELGATLIAVSPQSPDNTLSQTEKEQLTFVVASDIDGHVASLYNALYEVSGSLKKLYEKFQMDLAEYNATDRWVLPISATFVIDNQNVIQYVMWIQTLCVGWNQK